MAREKEDFRANLERLNELYPDHEMLTIPETMKVMGYASQNTVKKYVPFTNSRVSKATLARIMCGGAKRAQSSQSLAPPRWPAGS